MIPIVSPEQMRASEQAAVASGTPVDELMTRAARVVSDWVLQHLRRTQDDSRPIVAIVGPGNNGADALVVLALLAEAGLPTAAILVDRPAFGNLPAPPAALQRVRTLPNAGALDDARLILDGLYGAAGRAELGAVEQEILALANAAGRERGIPLVALDVPSGVDAFTGSAAEEAFQADVTLAIGMPKSGLLRLPAADFVGELVVLPIGLPEPGDFDGPWMIDADFARRALPRRGAFAHKSAIGAVLIVGGSPNYYGAPRLAAEAAMRAGAGLVGLATPRSLVPTIAAQLPEAIYKPINDADPRRAATSIRETLDEERFRAAVVGPGLGQDEASKDLMSSLLRRGPRRRMPVGFGIPDADEDAGVDGSRAATLSKPVVLDADALNWLAEQDNWPGLLTGVSAILTPHVGEFARLSGLVAEQITADPHAAAREYAQQWGQIVVLKCGYSCVASPGGQVFVAPRAPREMATAGTGDVLSGLIGGLLAQGVEPVKAAAVALYIGSRAGALAAARIGPYSVLARDVIDATPAALEELLSPWW